VVFHLSRYYKERHGKQMLRAAWLTPAGAEALAQARAQTHQSTDEIVDHALQLYALATRLGVEVVVLAWPYGEQRGAECTVALT
jgi:hypothetical protein